MYVAESKRLTAAGAEKMMATAIVPAAIGKVRLVKYASSGVRSPSAVCGRRPL